PLLERAFRGLPYGCKGGRDQIIQLLARRELSAKLSSLREQLLVAQRFELGLQRIDRRHLWSIALQSAVVGRTEDPLHDRVELQSRAEHFRSFRSRPIRRKSQRFSPSNDRRRR